MGLQIRDERQMKALTGLSQAQFDSLCPSSVISTEQPSNTPMKKGAKPAHAGVALVVAPKGNCPPWWRNYSLSSTIIKRILPLMSWARSL